MEDKIKVAVERLQLAADMSEKLYKKPLMITYSGGKDSDCLLRLAEIAKIPMEVTHNLTTADAPETVRHIYDMFQRLEGKGIKCTVDKHIQPDGSRVTMWNLIRRKFMPPTRVVRYCCAELKEGGGKGRMIATGVRWAESAARKKNRGVMEVLHTDRKKSLILSNDNGEDRQLFESCQMKGVRVANPIVDWTDDEVFAFCREEKTKLNPLYAEGFRRVGCIGCPMAGGKMRVKQFTRWPKYKAAYLRAFGKMLEARRARGLETTWETAEDVMHWWLNDGVLTGQEVMERFE